MEQAFGRAERNDWICIDSLTILWDDVQSWYMTKVHGKDMDDFLMQLRQQQMAANDNKKHTAAEGMFNEWQFINPQYAKAVTERVLNPPCHVYMTAELTKLGGEEKDQDVRGLYGPIGVKPKGQKRSGHNAQTVLVFKKEQRFGNSSYLLHTLKDRAREEVKDLEWSNFFMDYLVRVGGWRK
jgi:hypothetical protein